MKTFTSVAKELVALARERAANPSDVWGLPTGFESWNMITGGLLPGETTVIGARTSHGKTAFVLQAIAQVADFIAYQRAELGNDPGRVLVYSPEMTMLQIELRYVSALTSLQSRAMLQGRLSPEQLERWVQVTEQVMPSFDEVITMKAGDWDKRYERYDINDIKSDLEDTRREHRISLVVIDYLGLIYPRGRSTYERATEASQMIKSLAVQFDVPIVVASQCRRPETHWMKNGSVDDADLRPGMNELRDSGDIEQSADNVLMLYNPPPDQYHPVRMASVFVDKQRNGPVGSWKMEYHPATTSFMDNGDQVTIDGEQV